MPVDALRKRQLFDIFGVSTETPTIEVSPYHLHLAELSYEDLDEELFLHLFPALLNQWSNELVTGLGRPSGLYPVLRSEGVLGRLPADQRQLMLHWVADAYSSFVDAWGTEVGPLTTRLNDPMAHFHALGQSLPVTPFLLDRLEDVSTLGRALWWLVFATGVIWDRTPCPFHSAWEQSVDLRTSAAPNAYLPPSLDVLSGRITSETVLVSLVAADSHLFRTHHAPWLNATVAALLHDPGEFDRELARLWAALVTA